MGRPLASHSPIVVVVVAVVAASADSPSGGVTAVAPPIRWRISAHIAGKAEQFTAVEQRIGKMLKVAKGFQKFHLQVNEKPKA